MDGTQTRARVSRRLLLGVVGAGAASALLAACGGAATPTATTKPVEPTKPAAAATTAPAAATKPAEPTKPAAGATAAPAAGATTAPAGTPAAAATKPAASGTGAASVFPTPNTAIKIAGPYDGEASTLTGAGATFPAVLYTKWFSEYQKLTNVKVNYQSVGSGAGIQNFQNQTVDFGATDAPMTDQQMKDAKGGPAFHLTTAIGGVSVIYNIKEMDGKPGVKINGDNLAAIFLGDIKNWNDPKLVADNPDLAAVSKPIIVVRRSDSSGTTSIFTDYLSAVSEKWKTAVGKGTSVNWPVGIGGKGNEGVAGEVKQNPYAIGYVEEAYAIQNKLAEAQMKNQAGTWLAPSLKSVTAAASASASKIPPDLRVSIVNAPGADSYPIAGFTWMLVYEKQADKAKGIALSRMLWWAVTDGQKFNEDLQYAPIPPELVGQCQAMIMKMTYNGEPVFPGK